MPQRELVVKVSADIHQYQQAMTLAASSAHGFQQAIGAAGQSMQGFQSASSSAGSAATHVGQAQHQAASQVNSANSQIASSNNNAGNSFTAFAKKAVAIVGIGAAIKSTAKAGMDFQSQLNTLGAVSGASATQMKKVGDQARALGADIEIPGASAATAAQAMTELAKGGLNVQQSMAAAKGTLQLAAAAQIDGAEAAEIQAKAINTFGLAGKDAAHVGDVLANTANAASGEITDFAAALAQGGLVAHSMGISIDDTSTALGIFANQGLVGSDAGTSLKTMLVSLQSPTKQQAAALDQLGVKAFDAQGNFVGMRTITEELANAQATLTQEQYAAAASTAFGTDAVRAAVAVAAGGTEAWDNMAAAVGKAGGAAELAGAQTKGLKGAFGLVENAVQDAQIALMEKLSPALEAGTRSLADMVPALADSLVPALSTAGQAVIGIAQSALPLLASAATAIGPLFTAAADGVGAIMPVLNIVVGVVGAAANLFASLPAPVHAAVLAMLLLRTVRGPLNSVGTAAAGLRTQLTLMGRQISYLKFQGMNAGLATMRVGLRGLGVAAATAGRGLMAAFGGPVGLAIIGITTALSIFSSNSAEAAQRTQEFNDRSKELADTLEKTTGAISSDTTSKIVSDFANVASEFDNVGIKSGDAAQAIIDYGKGAAGAKAKVDGIRDSILKTTNVVDNSDINNGQAAMALDAYSTALGMTGITFDDLKRAALGGNDAIAAMASKIAAQGGDYEAAARKMRDYRGQAESAVPALRSLNAEQDVVAAGLHVQAEAFKTAKDAATAAAGAYGSQLQQAMRNASTSGASLEEAMTALNIPAEQQAAIMAALAPQLSAVGDKAHYMTPEAQAAAQALGVTGDKAGETAGNLDRLKGSVPTSALQALHGDADHVAGSVGGAATAVGDWAKALEDAKEPTGGLSSALAEVKAAADNVTTASDLMAAAVLRAAGVDLTAEQAQRENAAALRGITEGIYDKARASADDQLATRDRIQAEKDLAEAQKDGRKTDEDGKYTETQEEYDRRIIDSKDKVRDARRKEQDAHLKNAAAQTADKEAYGKAAQSALDMANKSGLAAAATGSVKDASKAAQVEIGKQRKAFIDAAVSAGVSEKAAAKLADQYGLTPKAVKTAFEAQIRDAEKNGTHLFQVYDKTTGTWSAQFLTRDDAAAKLKAGDVLKAYDKTKGKWTGKITADNVDALDKMEATQKKVDSLKGKEVQITYKGVITTPDLAATSGLNKARANAAGGYQVGPGTGTSDSILSWLSNGEYVVNAKATAKNRPLLEQINRDTPAFASGGFMGNSGKEIRYGITGSSAGAPDFAKMLADGAQGMASAVGKKLTASIPPIPAANYSGVSQWLPLAQKVFAAKGAPMSVLPIMMEQMKHESGGNPRAINLYDINAQRGTPSKGLLQFIDPTFRAYADPGYNTNIWDPESQIRAFLNYVPARYGSFDYLTRIGNGAYAEGGPVAAPGTGTSDSGLARVSNGEFIVNARSASKNYGLLHAINSGMPGFASGGLVGASALAGIGARNFGERESVTVQALQDLAASVRDLRASANTLAASARESATAARRVAADQASKVRETAKSGAGKVSAAENKLDEARKRSAKTAGQQAAKATAIARAEAALAKARTAAADANTKAEASSKKATASANAKAAADAKAATTAKQRADAESQNVKATAKLQGALRSSALHYDQVTAALSKANEKLVDLRAKVSDVVSDARSKALGLNGGILGDSSSTAKITADAIQKALRGDIAQQNAFTKTQQKALKLGLSASLVDSLSDVGGRGGDVLSAIVAGGSGKAKSIQALYSQLSAAGARSGNVRANALFGGQISQTSAQIRSLQIDKAGTEAALRYGAQVTAKAIRDGLHGTEMTLRAGTHAFDVVVDMRMKAAAAATKAAATGRRR
ncbi:phage tail tape measure protein [Nakamurella lactea]|uniref:phage tail tape measure protein n=1 Tax=Nakamurella lactea TaxID=459515 RepID=UPI0012B5CBE4|nr:phage tail tape measure protein [Nakamurella lactea]